MVTVKRFINEETNSDTSLNVDVINTMMNKFIGNWRKLFLLKKMLVLLPLFILISSALLLPINALLTNDLIDQNIEMMLVFVVIFSIISMTYFYKLLRSLEYKNINRAHFIEHLNINFDVLEHSAQLLIVNPQSLSPLQKLQQQKVFERFGELLSSTENNRSNGIVPRIKGSVWLISLGSTFILLCSLMFINQDQVVGSVQQWLSSSPLKVESPLDVITNVNKAEEIKFIEKQVTIILPSYSLKSHQLKETTNDNLNITTLAGSDVLWRFKFSQSQHDFYLVFSNGERYSLVKNENDNFQLKQTARSSMAYHIEVVEKNGERLPVSAELSRVYSLKVLPDIAPKIRFITPKVTVTEFGKNSQPELSTEVQITDDFAIKQVDILASIAKGSGESVKFRDQIFAFDEQREIDGKTHYFKRWNLRTLNMEPGDELYFSVIATDNKSPENQQTRSTTKIIRWLEEEQTGINADGILIDFMPEYFKSQRQIIIETIELIEDKNTLNEHKFVELSELLGVAQSALKEKYGQYLGDESEGQHSVGVDIDTEHHHAPKIHVVDDHGGSNAVITSHHIEDESTDVHQEPEHHHEGESTLTQNNDRSGRMAAISKYGHNHEDSDVGVMTSDDPRALMKKSLENMWEAELHLMLSAPAKALPYEQKALKLLKQAKKAERIYVKRLGFEPPPVTEQRRYQGELTDIIHGQVSQLTFSELQLSDQTSLALIKLLNLINNVQQPLGEESIKHQLLDKDIIIVREVKKAMQTLVTERPGLIDALTTVEQILLHQSLELAQCSLCVTDLADKLTQLLAPAKASPTQSQLYFNDDNSIISDYVELLGDEQ